jgi:hypothetical protein
MIYTEFAENTEGTEQKETAISEFQQDGALEGCTSMLISTFGDMTNGSMVTEADWQAWKPGDMEPYLDVAFECFRPSRLLIGSDWPVCTVAAPYWVMELVKNYLGKYPAEDREAVLGGNAAKFWRLKPQENQSGD